MSFLKYQEDADIQKGNGRGPVSFSRAHIDGMPFRGQPVPLREEEYDEFTEVVRDFDMGIFDVGDPEQAAKLREVFDKAVNNWVTIVDYEKQWETRDDGTKTVLVYLMWSTPHRELAKGRATQLMGSPIPQNYLSGDMPGRPTL